MRSRRAAAALLAFLCPLLLTGCWNYRGLDELTVVAGIAIDRAENGGYLVSFETVDLSVPVESEGLRSLVLEAEGATLFDAIRNAKQIEPNKLYFGNTSCVILHESLAREGLDSLFDLFVRLTEFRETISVLIARTERASDLFLPEAEANYILSYELESILDTDEQTTASSKEVRLYQAYNDLRTEGEALVLPVFDLITGANGKDQPALQGLALFQGDGLANYLPADRVKAFLAVTDDLQGGVLTADGDGDGKEQLSFEITKAHTKQTFTPGEEVPSLRLEVALFGTLVESDVEGNLLDEAVTGGIEDMLAVRMREQVAAILDEAKLAKQDIFGLGGALYRQKPEEWERCKDNWPEIFAAMPVELSVSVKVQSVSMLKH